MKQPGQLRSYLIAACSAFATAFSIAVPRVGPLVAIGITTALSCAILLQNPRQQLRDLAGMIWYPETAFILVAFAGCAWAVAPISAMGKVLFLALLFTQVVIIAQNAASIGRHDIVMLSRGIILGFIAGALYFLLETQADNIIARSFLSIFPDAMRGLDKHATFTNGSLTSFSVSHISRVGSVLILLFCPALLAATFCAGPWRSAAYASLAIVLLALLLHPNIKSQTAQIAALAVASIRVIALLSVRYALWTTTIAFAASVLLIVPTVLQLYQHGAHKDERLFESARARVIIWNYTAEQVLQSPLTGVGTYSTRYLDDARPREEKIALPDTPAAAATRAHPHNVYLQIWYELGAIGAVAFAALGISVLLRIYRNMSTSTPIEVAHFAVCATVIAFSYGLWQSWFQSAIALSVMLIVILRRLNWPLAEPRNPNTQ